VSTLRFTAGRTRRYTMIVYFGRAGRPGCSMKRIGIFYHPLKEAACTLARELTASLREQRLAVWLCSAWEWEQSAAQIEGTDLVLSIGGDGTILRAAQAVIPRPIPITGINLGRLGFMTELSVRETMVKLPLLLDGQGAIDTRAVLEAVVETPAGKEPLRFNALNDVVIARGGTPRLVNVDARIDGLPLTTYRSDGVVVASATGSTGYALAAGGPILHPQSRDFVLVPILPHLSYAFPMVLPPASVARLGLAGPTPGILSIDGHINIDLAAGDVVTVRIGTATVDFLRIHQTHFYSSVEERLKGKQPADAHRES
jgi:NAD+ kinase